MKRAPPTRNLREAANLVLTLWRVAHARRPELPLDMEPALHRAVFDLEQLAKKYCGSWDELRFSETDKQAAGETARKDSP